MRPVLLSLSLLLSGKPILLGRNCCTISAEMPNGSDTHNCSALCSFASRHQMTRRVAPCKACQRPGAPSIANAGVRRCPRRACAHLLDILLRPAVRRMHNCPHHFHVATDNQGFVRRICVYSHSTMTDNRFWNLSSLPQCITVIFKLPRVRGLEKIHKYIT